MEPKCAHCGGPFWGTPKPDQRYCLPRCRRQAQKARHNAHCPPCALKAAVLELIRKHETTV
jgi:hypothetical protein